MPAFPPIEATIGINTASATTFSIEAWKKPITIEAITAVSKFTNSHENLDFVVSITASYISACPTPPNFNISSSLSSSITSTTSSTVIDPITSSLLFITGALTIAYLLN